MRFQGPRRRRATPGPRRRRLFVLSFTTPLPQTRVTAAESPRAAVFFAGCPNTPIRATHCGEARFFLRPPRARRKRENPPRKFDFLSRSFSNHFLPPESGDELRASPVAPFFPYRMAFAFPGTVVVVGGLPARGFGRLEVRRAGATSAACRETLRGLHPPKPAQACCLLPFVWSNTLMSISKIALYFARVFAWA